MFLTQWTAVPSSGEVNSGEVRVDPAGYIPAKTMIENFMVAGQALDDARRRYDSDDYGDIDIDSFEDPTRNPDYDIADAAQARLALDERFEEAKATQKAKADEAANKKPVNVPPDESGEAQ